MNKYKNYFKFTLIIFTILSGIIFFTPEKIFAQTNYSNAITSPSNNSISPKGTTSKEILSQAPCPVVLMQGKRKTATIVVDITNNILYKYDKKGNPEIAYSVASGKQSTPTSVGIRLVSHVEYYPYKTAPPQTNRRKKPSAFGPNVIILTMVDSYSGVKWNNSEYIHGTDKPASIGKHSSHGCIRMDNDAIIKLSHQVKHDDIVVMRK